MWSVRVMIVMAMCHSNDLFVGTGVSGRSNSRSAEVSSSFIVDESVHHDIA